MKIFALTLTLLFVFLGMTASEAQAQEMVIIKAGQQRTAAKSKLRIKFISLIEDSRCPIGVDCIWAGNAKIRVQVVGERSTKVFEMNSTLGPKGDILDGWAIMLEELTPVPRANRKTNPKNYTATFKISRLTR
jgi:hypothetical protein